MKRFWSHEEVLITWRGSNRMKWFWSQEEVGSDFKKRFRFQEEVLISRRGLISRLGSDHTKRFWSHVYVWSREEVLMTQKKVSDYTKIILITWRSSDHKLKWLFTFVKVEPSRCVFYPGERTGIQPR